MAADLPNPRLVGISTYPAIDTSLGNPYFPGSAEIYVIFNDSLDRIWGSTALPIWIFNVVKEGLILNPYGQNRDVPLVGDRGEVYSWIERVPGEVWAGLYGGEDQIVRMAPSRAGFDQSGVGVSRVWRPYGVATDGTVTWWGVGGTTALGEILEVDAAGAGTLHSGLFLQEVRTMHYDSGKLYVGSSAEGKAGSSPVAPRFHQIDVATMTVDWSTNLSGSRPLSMYRYSPDQYLFINHLTSDTVARLAMINLTTMSREWTEIQPDVKIFGRSRNSIVSFAGELWCMADDAFCSIDVPNRRIVKRANFPGVRNVDPPPGQIPVEGRIINCVAHDELGLVAGVDRWIYAWDPRAA